MRDSGDIAWPVLLAVPPQKQSLAGRERVLFLRRYARRAVALSAERQGRVLGLLENDSAGRPVPENGIFWSLSHKPEIVAGVAAGRPVGIDIETLRPVRAGLMEEITDALERRLAEAATDLLFFRFWTAKEAVLKAVGWGFSGLSQCRIRDIVDPNTLILCCDGRHWRVSQCFYGPHVASATSADDLLTWRWTDPETEDLFLAP